MNDGTKVYATCPHCRKQVLCERASAGPWYLVQHDGKRRGKKCEGGLLAVDPPAPPICQLPGCWRTAGVDSIYCLDCAMFYHTIGQTPGKGWRDNEAGVPLDAP